MKHVPRRTCVGCRQTQAKRELVRVVRTPQGTIEIDPTGKRPGRGAYVHRDADCWKQALKGKLEAALRVSLGPENRTALEEHARRLAEMEQVTPDGGRGARQP